jgi:hypothetical protein
MKKIEQFLSIHLLALALSTALVPSAGATDGELTVNTGVSSTQDKKSYTSVTVDSGSLTLTDSTIATTLTVEGTGIAHLKGTTIEAPAVGKPDTSSCISDTAVATFQSTTINSSELKTYNTGTATFSDNCSVGSLSLSGNAMVTVNNRNLTDPCHFGEIETTSTNRINFAGDGSVLDAPSETQLCYLTVSPNAATQLGWIIESDKDGTSMVPLLQNTQITTASSSELPSSSYTVVVSLVQSYMAPSTSQSDFSGLLKRYKAATTQTPPLQGIPLASLAAGSHAPKAFALEFLTGFTEDATKTLTYQTTAADFSNSITDGQKRSYQFGVVSSSDSLSYYLTVKDTTPASSSLADLTATQAPSETGTGAQVSAPSSQAEEVKEQAKTSASAVADGTAVKAQVASPSSIGTEGVEGGEEHIATLPDSLPNDNGTREQVAALSVRVEEVQEQVRNLTTFLRQVNHHSQSLTKVLVKLQQQQIQRDHQILSALRDIKKDVRKNFRPLAEPTSSRQQQIQRDDQILTALRDIKEDVRQAFRPLAEPTSFRQRQEDRFQELRVHRHERPSTVAPQQLSAGVEVQEKPSVPSTVAPQQLSAGVVVQAKPSVPSTVAPQQLSTGVGSQRKPSVPSTVAPQQLSTGVGSQKSSIITRGLRFIPGL